MTIMNVTQGGGRMISFATQPVSFPMTIDPPEGYDGISSVMVVAPANLSSANIKKDVTIAGVTGTYEGSGSSDALARFVDGTITDITADMLGGLTSIANFGFYGRESLTTLELPDTLTTIGDYAMARCTSLTEMTIPPNVTSMGYYIFNTANNLTELTMKPTVPPTINSDTLTFAKALATIIVPQGCLEAYQTATNWVKYKDMMQEASE